MKRALTIVLLISFSIFVGCVGTVSPPEIYDIGYLSYVGYGDLSVVWEIADNKADNISGGTSLPVVKIESADELALFKTAVNGEFDLDSTYNQIQGFNSVCKNFDSEFFNDKCLIVVVFTDITSSCRYSFDVTVDREITVKIKRGLPKIADEAMSGWIQVVVMNKTDSCCDSISAVIINE